ncbi:MAG: tripartite tricarboxylate transporter TctB family protein [Pseudomonadota bacterium]
MIKLPADRLGGLLILPLILVYISGIYQIPASSNPGIILSAASLPTLIAIMAGICCVWLILKPNPSDEVTSFAQYNWRRLGIFILLMLGYAYSLPLLGFGLPTSVFIGAGIWLLKRDRPGLAACVGLVTTSIFWFAVTYGLNIYLPLFQLNTVGG